MSVLEWTCRTCGEQHEGLPLDFGFPAPHYWDGDDDHGWLTDDLCRIEHADQTDFFIRGVLEIPVVDLEETFRFGAWTSLSEASFERVVELWDAPPDEHEGYFGWLANSIPGYAETLNLRSDVVMREPRLRPLIVLHDGDHPLIREQRDGITSARVREIAEQNLHRG